MATTWTLKGLLYHDFGASICLYIYICYSGTWTLWEWGLQRTLLCLPGVGSLGLQMVSLHTKLLHISSYHIIPYTVGLQLSTTCIREGFSGYLEILGSCPILGLMAAMYGCSERLALLESQAGLLDSDSVPKDPYAAHSKPLAPKLIPGLVVGTRVLKWSVYGPFGCRKLIKKPLALYRAVHHPGFRTRGFLVSFLHETVNREGVSSFLRSRIHSSKKSY